MSQAVWAEAGRARAIAVVAKARLRRVRVIGRVSRAGEPVRFIWWRSGLLVDPA
jgi:hypothetical protein